MLSGQFPLYSEEEGELLAMHINREPAPLLDLVGSLPLAVSQLIHRMLAKKPTERPSMSGVASELEQQHLLWSRHRPLQSVALPEGLATQDGGIPAEPLATDVNPLAETASDGLAEAAHRLGETESTQSSQPDRTLHPDTPLRRALRLSLLGVPALAGVVLAIALFGGMWTEGSPQSREPVPAQAAAGAAQSVVSSGVPAKPHSVPWKIDSIPSEAVVLLEKDGSRFAPLRLTVPSDSGFKQELKLTELRDKPMVRKAADSHGKEPPRQLHEVPQLLD